MRDILITEKMFGAAVDALHSRFDVAYEPEIWKDPAALQQAIRDFRAVIVRNQTRLHGDVLAAGKNLVVIGRAGVGLENVDVLYASKAGVLVTSTPDQNAISVAELTIGLILALARHIPDADHDTRAGGWNRQQFLGTELYGKTFGIVGFGKNGFLTARRAQALGMKVVAYDPFLSRDNVYLNELGAELVAFDDLLARADVVSCHIPATPETKHLFNAQKLSLMKPAAYLINTARGEVICEKALVEALKSKQIAGAALDVRSTEPPVAGELELLPNVICTPHIAAFTHEAQERVTTAVCEDVANILDGRPPQNAVNAATITAGRTIG